MATPSLSPVPTRASLRKLLNEVLKGDTDLDAFCLDHFESTYQRFTNGLDRVQKVTLLLLYERHDAILARLREVHEQAVIDHQDLLQYEPAKAQPAPRWPAKLGGPEVAELVSALISAFPKRSALAQMLRFGLDQSLDEIAGPGNLRDTVFEVVTHAEAHGIVPALFDAAHAAAPSNPEILAIAAKRRPVG